MKCAVLIVFAVLVAAPAVGQQVTKETLEVEGAKRTFYLFVPEKREGAAPLIVTLHGSGRDGKILVDHWKGLAEKQGIILSGPDATKRDEWHGATDGPAFLHVLVEHLKSKYPVDPRRVYVFGHSA